MKMIDTRVTIADVMMDCPLWFSEDTMRFFGSKILDYSAQTINDFYFITSEKRPVTSEVKTPRLFSIRKWAIGSGEIETVGEFQAYKTLATAKTALKNLVIKGE